MKTVFAWNFLQLTIQVCRGALVCYFKINATFFCCPLFFKEYLNSHVRTNKMINEHSVDLVKTRILAYFMQCNDTSSCIIIYSSGAYLSSEKLLNFLSDLFIPPLLGKFFSNLWCWDWKMHLRVKKCLDVFTHVPLPQGKTLQQDLITPISNNDNSN